MKKSVLKFLSLIAVVILACALVSCDREDDNDVVESTGVTTTSAPKDDDNKTEATFKLSLSKDETYYSITGYADGCTESALIIPDTYKGLPIKRIESRAFDKSDKVVSVVFGDNVETTGMFIFRECPNLKTVILGKGMKTVGNEAFLNCTNLEEIYFNDGLEAIQNTAFSGCTKLKEINLPDSVTSLGTGVFKGCSSVTSATLGKGLTSVVASAFEDCTSLKNVTYKGNVTAIGNAAFKNCTSLGASGITFPDDLYQLGEEAFKGCTSLTSINWPKSLINKVGKSAFSGCTSLREVRGTILGLGSNSANVSSGFNNPLFFGCTSLKEVTISAINIGGQSFEGCTSLEKVTIKDPGTSQLIGYRAFAKCTSLIDIIIPTSVKTFGQHPLIDSTNKERLHILYEGTAKEWNELLKKSPTYMDSYLNACLYTYSASEPADEENYWHYVGGYPEIWNK